LWHTFVNMKTISGIIIGTLLSFAFVFVEAKVKLPSEYQDIEPGIWLDEYTQFNTYEELCTGYYLVDYSNKNKIKYIGYGDLAGKYTYETFIDTFSIASSSN
jgi:hypothetical protein